MALLVFVQNVKVEHGKLTTPDGTPFFGVKISIGEITDPATIKRTYDDIEKIMGRNQVPFKIHEEKTAAGTFRSYSVETG